MALVTAAAAVAAAAAAADFLGPLVWEGERVVWFSEERICKSDYNKKKEEMET